MKNLFNRLKEFFTAPVFEGDKEKTQSAKLLYQIITVIWGLPVLLIVIMVLRASGRAEVVPPAIVISITLLALMIFTRIGWVGLANTIITGMIILVFSYADFQNAGNIQPSTLVIAIAIIMSGLLLGRRAPLVTAILIAISHGVIVFLQMRGAIKVVSAPALGIENIIITGIMILMIGFLFQFVISRLQSAVQQAHNDEEELRKLNMGLEQRVAERTKALVTSAEVSRRLTAILDPRELASEVVNQVQTAFNYYYAQIYLFDETGENLVLTSGTGEAGKAMLKRGHALPKGRGLVGHAAESGESILVSDTSQDPDWLPNDLLPETKAEAAIPIALGNKVLGVLDVQDNITNDINSDDIILLESLASQVAISLQNAELYARAEATLQEARSLVDNAPEAIIIVDLATGLFADPNENAVKLYGLPREELVKVGPAQMSPPRQPDGSDSTEAAMARIGEAMQGGTPVFEWIHRNAQGQDFPCEIRLVRMPGEHPRVRASITNITERKGLQELTAQRARQQETINVITQRIQAATTIEEAMQVAARELGNALGKRQTLVALESSALVGESKIQKESVS
ncbi:MAG: GAF domain-containing protein [Chloroflexota bacterium]